MAWQAWLTLGVVALCFWLLLGNRWSPDSVLMGGLTLLLVSGAITPAQALAGFANEGMVTVGVLYIVVTGLRETGAIAWLGQAVLGRPRSLHAAQLRLMLPVAGLSAFLNNTPVVAMFIPAVLDWAKRCRLPVSRLLMPLSFAAIAGGTCTLIGTSTNLVVNGLLKSETGHPGLGLLDIAWVGLPTTLAVIGFVVLATRALLPERRSAEAQFADPRRYTVEMLVEADSPLDGKTIEQAGLRQLPGMYLIEIERGTRLIPAVGPEERLTGGDRLVFAGVVDSVLDLRRIRGLKPATDQVFKLGSAQQDRLLIEAVVSDTCPLVGKSVRSGRFRTLYNAAIIAVSRNGERIRSKIGDIVLKPGDTLLLEAHPSFVEQQRNSRDFFLVSHVEGSEPPRHDRALRAMLIVVGMVVSVLSGLLSMLQAAMLAAGLLILGGCTSGRIARRAVDWQVLVVIAASFGIGSALSATGAAATLAGGLVRLCAGQPLVALAVVFAVTALFSALITNNAAAVLMFPIARAAAGDLGVDFLPFAITLMMAASASFATPIAYQTNLMVYGPGGYRFADYLRLGLPLTLLVGVIAVTLAPLIWPF